MARKSTARMLGFSGLIENSIDEININSLSKELETSKVCM